jgi:hypothetical protein
MGDFAGHAAGVELVAGLLRVIAGVEVDRDVIGQRPDDIEFVQRGRQQRGVVLPLVSSTPMPPSPVSIAIRTVASTSS